MTLARKNVSRPDKRERQTFNRAGFSQDDPTDQD
jgi:hypothetical protein